VKTSRASEALAFLANAILALPTGAGLSEYAFLPRPTNNPHPKYSKQYSPYTLLLLLLLLLLLRPPNFYIPAQLSA
jgi:hypothetical protein